MMSKLPKDALKWVSVAAALAATATAEYNLAVEIGMHEWVAPAVPVALDAYVLRALQRGREVFVSVLAMVGVNAASHLEHAGMIPMDWRLTTAVAAIAPLVLWRVHALKHGQARGWWSRGTSTNESTTSTEHERVPDESGDDGAREHESSMCFCGAEVWGDLGAHQRAPGHGAREHKPSTEEPDLPDWLREELDVPDWLQEAQTHTRRVIADVPIPFFPPVPEHVPLGHEPVLTLVPPLPGTFERRSTDTASTSLTSTEDADGHNLWHVAAGRLEPADTAYMERARAVFNEHGGGRGIVLAMKSGVGTGNARASRLAGACAYEHDGGTA
jgi:hypothetical protein